MAFASLATLMFRILFMASLGFGMRKTGVINDEIQKGLSTILLNVVIPLNMLAVGNSSYDTRLAQNLLWAGLFTVAIYGASIAAGIGLGRRLKLEPRNQKMFANLLILGNVGYIGIPIVSEVYGPEGALYAIVYNLLFQIIAYTVCLKLAGGEVTLRGFFTKPMTLCPIIAILIFVSPFRLPAFMVAAFSEVGSLSAPFALFIIGASLGRIPLSTLFTEKYAWLAVFSRQVVFAGGMAVLLYALGFSGVLPGVMVVLTGMPPATINIIFAQQHDGDMPLATKAVVLGTVMMMATLPLSVLLCQRLFM